MFFKCTGHTNNAERSCAKEGKEKIKMRLDWEEEGGDLLADHPDFKTYFIL